MRACQETRARLIAEPRVWLVTGAAGFIGSHLVEELLLLGQRVRALDDFSTGSAENLAEVAQRVGSAWERFELVEADVCDEDGCRSACAGADIVLHQAALGSVPRSFADPARTLAVNVRGFLSVLDAARATGCERVVYASSSSVYGDDPQELKCEERLGTPLSPYAASKRLAEIYAAVRGAASGLHVVGLRYFNVFGPRQDASSPYAAVIPRWIAELSSGALPRVYGDGETARDFCPVANVVQANLLAAVAPRAGAASVYNVALGGATTLNELFVAIRERLASRGVDCADVRPIHEAVRPGDVRHGRASLTRAAGELGYAPQVGLQAGLDRTIDAYRAAARAAAPLGAT